MKRRIFNVLAAVSLGMCLAAAAAWLPSGARYLVPPPFVARNHYVSPDVGLGHSGLWICRTTQVALSAQYARWYWLGFEYGRELGWWQRQPMPTPTVVVSEWLVVPLWFVCVLTAILPAIWLRRYRCDSRLRTDGMPHCAKCDYNLTGNVSGICPECGASILGRGEGRGEEHSSGG